MVLRTEIAENNFANVDALHQRFLSRPSNSANAPVIQDVDQDAGSSDEEDDDDEMEEAPALVQTRERQERVVDDDGFELVQKPRRR